jgi:hypothetical protein
LWGNNVFSYDEALKVRGLGRSSRSLEQLEGIYLGVHPKIKLMVNDANRAEAASLSRLRLHLQVVGWIAPVAMVTLLFCLIAWFRTRGRASSLVAIQGAANNGA